MCMGQVVSTFSVRWGPGSLKRSWFLCANVIKERHLKGCLLKGLGGPCRRLTVWGGALEQMAHTVQSPESVPHRKGRPLKFRVEVLEACGMKNGVTYQNEGPVSFPPFFLPCTSPFTKGGVEWGGTTKRCLYWFEMLHPTAVTLKWSVLRLFCASPEEQKWQCQAALSLHCDLSFSPSLPISPRFSRPEPVPGPGRSPISSKDLRDLILLNCWP